MSAFLFTLVAVIIFFSLYQYSTSGPRPPRGAVLPPGPPGKPIVGNLPDIPPKHSWLKFKE